MQYIYENSHSQYLFESDRTTVFVFFDSTEGPDTSLIYMTRFIEIWNTTPGLHSTLKWFFPSHITILPHSGSLTICLACLCVIGLVNRRILLGVCRKNWTNPIIALSPYCSFGMTYGDSMVLLRQRTLLSCLIGLVQFFRHMPKVGL